MGLLKVQNKHKKYYTFGFRKTSLKELYEILCICYSFHLGFGLQRKKIIKQIGNPIQFFLLWKVNI